MLAAAVVESWTLARFAAGVVKLRILTEFGNVAAWWEMHPGRGLYGFHFVEMGDLNRVAATEKPYRFHFGELLQEILDAMFYPKAGSKQSFALQFFEKSKSDGLNTVFLKKWHESRCQSFDGLPYF